MYEMAMKSYAQEPSAGAIVISDEYSVSYGYNRQFRNYYGKVKIFSPSYLDWGVVSIYYYSPSGEPGEKVSRIRATTYNLVDGKIEKTKLNPKEVIAEDLGGGYKAIHFAAPDVRPGSVVEYGYRISAPHSLLIPPFEIQKDIPVVSSRLKVSLPPDVVMAAVIKGASIMRSSEGGAVIAGYPEQIIPFYAYMNYEWSHVPSFRLEPLVWSENDMRIRCEFQPISMDDGVWVYDLTPSWKEITERLKPVLLPDTVHLPERLRAAVDAIPDTVAGTRAAVRRIRDLVAGSVKWNNLYTLYPENPDSVLAAGSGGSGSLNYLLLSALRHAGTDAEPVFLNPRSRGRMPIHTYEEDIATYVARVKLADGSFVHIDATDPDSDIDMLGEELMPDRARLFQGDSLVSTWTDLSRIGRNRITRSIKGGVSPSGELRCTVEEYIEGAPAYREALKWRGQLFDGDYRREAERQAGVSFDSFDFAKDSAVVRRSYTFSVELEKGAQGFLLAVAPTAGGWDNPVPEEVRRKPFEFPWPVEYTVRVEIDLPEGFTAAEAPGDKLLRLPGDGLTLVSLYSLDENRFAAAFTLRMSRLIYGADERGELRGFFDIMKEMFTETITIYPPETD